MQADSTTVRNLLIAKFEALLAECDLVADNAAFGQTLDDMDEFFLIKGRKFLQETFEAKLQERIKRTEAAAQPPQCPKCKKNDSPRPKDQNDHLRPWSDHPLPPLLFLLPV